MAWQDPNFIGLIVIHHSAQRTPMNKDWRSINRSHLVRFKLGLGYHMVMERDGTVMWGRRIQRVGAHAPPNQDRFGICGIGWNEADHMNLSDDAIEAGWKTSWEWPEKMWDALIQIQLPYLVQIMPAALICGHNQTKPTLCPGFDVSGALLERGWQWPEKLLAGQIHRG
jgi:hypothetical protein